MDLNQRLQAAYDAGSPATRDTIDAALQWWITMHGDVDYAEDNDAYRSHRHGETNGTTYYLWHTGSDWVLLCDFDQADTQLLCPVSAVDEDAISSHLDGLGY